MRQSGFPLRWLVKSGISPSIIVFLALPALLVHPQQITKPLDKNQVMELVKAGMDSADLAEKVKQVGIDFDLTEDFLQALRQAGAQDVLIAALRAIRPKPLTREQVLQLVAGGVPSQRAAELVRQRGIDFAPDDHYLETLRVAGAEEVLLAALRAVGEAVPAPGDIKTNLRDGLKYVFIPAGTFQMGCSPGDLECGADENPAHRVTISQGFWMGQTEVTVLAYKRYTMATGKSLPPEANILGRPLNRGWSNDALPMVNVTWDEAQNYCTWAGGRLPTEAEWEYAARAGSTDNRYGPPDEIAWYGDNSGQQRLDSAKLLKDDQKKYEQHLKDNDNGMHEVAQKRANAFGLFDVLGNVGEWVNDWHDQDYYKNSPGRDPMGPPTGTLRVIRGGSWYYSSRNLRFSIRGRFAPDGRNIYIGFRCTRDVVGR